MGGGCSLWIRLLVLSIFVSIVGLICGGVAIVLGFSFGKPVLFVSLAIFVANFGAGELLDDYDVFLSRKKKR
jgi:membrane protein required for beta-lactamase induction